MVEKTEPKTGSKKEDLENMKPKVILIRRLFIFNTFLMIVSYLLPYIIPYIYPEISHTGIIIISMIIGIVVIIIFCILLVYMSSVAKKMAPPSVSLAEKMMKCKLRIENGLDYCAKCPDGYTCASGKENSSSK